MSDFMGLFGAPLAASLAMLAILVPIGMHVLKREVIFIDIALAQFAAVGALLAHLFFHAHGDSLLGYASAFSMTLLAAAFYSVINKKVRQLPLEAIIGVTYAIAAAGALFAVGVATGGHMHVRNMLAGNLLLAGRTDVVRSIAVFAAAGILFFLCRKPLGQISQGYDKALAEGFNVIWWDFVFYAIVGVVITQAVAVGGVVVVFAFLIIPATTSALASSRWGMRLVAAWAVGAGASVGGVLFANKFDFSLGTSISFFLVLILIAAALLRLLPGNRGIKQTL